MNIDEEAVITYVEFFWQIKLNEDRTLNFGVSNMKGIGDIYLAVSWRDEYKVGLEWIKQRMGGELKKTSRANSGGILLQRREVK